MVTEIEILPSGKVRLNSWSGRKIRLSSVFLTNRADSASLLISFSQVVIFSSKLDQENPATREMENEGFEKEK
jgi:hypothetical protein